MKKVRYVATMVVEFEVTEDMEIEMFPNGLNKESLKEEMQSDVFDELFEGELVEYKAEGFLIENGQVVAQHKETFIE